MKRSIKLILILVVLSNSVILFGQGGSTDIVFNMRTGTNRASVRNTLPQNSGIEYTPYLYDFARPAQIILFSGDTVDGDFVYNIEIETLESMNNSNSYTWNEIQSFEFKSKDNLANVNFTNLKLLWPNNEYGGFFQNVASSTQVKVLNYLNFIPMSYNPSTQTGDRNDQIVKATKIYLKVNNDWIESPESKTAFFDLFGMRSEALRKYARKNKLKHDNPEDVGKMIIWVTRK
jgi:hypothetical protein